MSTKWRMEELFQVICYVPVLLIAFCFLLVPFLDVGCFLAIKRHLLHELHRGILLLMIPYYFFCIGLGLFLLNGALSMMPVKVSFSLGGDGKDRVISELLSFAVVLCRVRFLGLIKIEYKQPRFHHHNPKSLFSNGHLYHAGYCLFFAYQFLLFWITFTDVDYWVPESDIINEMVARRKLPVWNLKWW